MFRFLIDRPFSVQIRETKASNSNSSGSDGTATIKLDWLNQVVENNVLGDVYEANAVKTFKGLQNFVNFLSAVTHSCQLL